MGLIGCLFTAVERPGDLNLIPPELFVTKPAIWLRTLSATRATISPAPNFAYGLCVEKIRDDEMRGVDLSSWRVALNGAETVVGNVARAFSDRFSRWGFDPRAMTPVYGLSEASLAVTFSDLDRPFSSRQFSRDSLSANGVAREDPEGVEIVSVGRAIPGCTVSVRDQDGSVLEEGRVGRVWAQSPSLMDGYFRNRPATQRVLRDGWLDTGDLGFLCDGDLFLTGRAKDVLILRGLNHLPDDVENAVDSVPGARTGCSAAVSYLPEGEHSEILMLLVERSQDGKGKEDSNLAERCRRAVLAKTGIDATRIEILAPGTLPRTSSGKIRRRRALELFLAKELKPPAPVTAVGLVKTMAKSHAALKRSERSRERERQS
jgi:acyl-CoA synthetase (AMP-forming)/AMP-acid ligase II